MEDDDQRAAKLRDVEHRRLKALVDADVETANALHADDYQLITPGGASLSKEAYLGQIADGTLVYRQFEPDGEIAVLVLGPSAAAARYQVLMDVEFPGGHEAARYWHTDIYESRAGRWQAVWSQATRIRSD